MSSRDEAMQLTGDEVDTARIEESIAEGLTFDVEVVAPPSDLIESVAADLPTLDDEQLRALSAAIAGEAARRGSAV